jgi:hypothetical protein
MCMILQMAISVRRNTIWLLIKYIGINIKDVVYAKFPNSIPRSNAKVFLFVTLSADDTKTDSR